MAKTYTAEQRSQVLARLSSGEPASAVSDDTGISRSTLNRWQRDSTPAVSNAPTSLADEPPAAAVVPPVGGKVCDLTGTDLTGRWGVGATDLGASILAPNGKLVSVFGDTFSGAKCKEGDWRSPVILIGTIDANLQINYEQAGGPDLNYARQLWHYIHDSPPAWAQGGISTVLPSDLLRVHETLYLHVMVNQGLGNVRWTEIWSSDDNGISWQHMGENAKFPSDLHGGFAQCWSWDYDPDDEWVYIVSTGFQRDKGIILRRVRPEHIGDQRRYSGWGYVNQKWEWDNEPSVITPLEEKWGELCLRRLDKGTWVLGGFLASKYALGYRTIGGPTADLWDIPVQTPVTGCEWNQEDHGNNRVAQLYGGYVLPGSQLDVPGGAGLVVSQWNTETHYPYHAMLFKETLKDTTRERRDGINL